MPISRILITQHSEQNNNVHLVANLNIHKNLSDQEMDSLMREFKEKVIRYTQKEKKVFSNFKELSHEEKQSNREGSVQPSFISLTPLTIEELTGELLQKRHHYLEEVKEFTMNQIIEIFKELNFIKENYLMTPQFQFRYNDMEIEVINTTTQSQRTFLVAEFIDYFHNEFKQEISLQEFSKLIVQTWDKLTF